MKFLKKRIGSHDLAKKKREEMQAVLQAQRKKIIALVLCAINDVIMSNHVLLVLYHQ